MSVEHWRKLARLAEERGLGSRVISITEDPETPVYGTELRPTDPPEAAIDRLLPAEYRAFVSAVGYVAVDFGHGARLAFLPPRVMRQVTGAMGERDRDFDEVRTEREQGRYTWPFAFFAGDDLAEVNGWCFAADKAGDIAVWAVEDSVHAAKPKGAFQPWLEKELSRLASKIDTPAKARARLRELREDEGVEQDEPLPALSLASFGA